MEISKKVQLIQRDLMKVAENHGTGKSTANLEAFIYATALVFIVYVAGTKSNNIKRGLKECRVIIKRLGKHLKRGRV
jgi:hypothetical protein